MSHWESVFSKHRDSMWVVAVYMVWSIDGWKKIEITAADCHFLSTCGIKWD